MQISTTLQDQFADAIDTALGAAGVCRFYSAAYAAELAECNLNSPAFNTSTGGLITLDVAPAIENNATPVVGTAALLAFYNGTADIATAFIFSLGIAESGSPDVTMSNASITATDTVQVSSLQIQVPVGTPTV